MDTPAETLTAAAEVLGKRASDLTFHDVTVYSMARLYARLFDLLDHLERENLTITDLTVDRAVGQLDPASSTVLSIYEDSRRELSIRRTMWHEFVLSTNGVPTNTPIDHDARELSKRLSPG